MMTILTTKNGHLFDDAWLIVEKERDVLPGLNAPPTACARHSESGVALSLATAVHRADVRQEPLVRSAFRLRRFRRMRMRMRKIDFSRWSGLRARCAAPK